MLCSFVSHVTPHVCKHMRIFPSCTTFVTLRTYISDIFRHGRTAHNRAHWYSTWSLI